MSPDQIIAVVTALLTGASNPDFDNLKDGGHDPRYPVKVEACEFPPGSLEVEGQTVLCGTISVPEDYDLPEGRRIPLEFAIMAARTQSPAPDPMIYLHGGPASGTLNMLGPVSERLFANHRRTRDLVTFDQRAAALSSRTVSCTKGMAEHIEELVSIKQKKLPESGLAELVAPCVAEIRASDADLSACPPSAPMAQI